MYVLYSTAGEQGIGIARLRKLLDGAEGNAMPKQHRPEGAPSGDRTKAGRSSAAT